MVHRTLPSCQAALELGGTWGHLCHAWALWGTRCPALRLATSGSGGHGTPGRLASRQWTARLCPPQPPALCVPCQRVSVAGRKDGACRWAGTADGWGVASRPVLRVLIPHARSSSGFPDACATQRDYRLQKARVACRPDDDGVKKVSPTPLVRGPSFLSEAQRWASPAPGPTTPAAATKPPTPASGASPGSAEKRPRHRGTQATPAAETGQRPVPHWRHRSQAVRSHRRPLPAQAT